MPIDIARVIRLLWMIVFTVWVAAAYESNEPIYSRSDRRSRVIVWTIALAWCLLLFRRVPAPLDWRLLQPPCLLIWTGVVLAVVGLSFAVWARVCLGRSWDAYIRLKPNHKLIRTGPYAIVRHPIYSGFMLAAIGTAFVVGQLRAFVAAALIIAAWVYKCGLEEHFLSAHFGAEYEEYRRTVKRLMPYLW